MRATFLKVVLQELLLKDNGLLRLLHEPLECEPNVSSGLAHSSQKSEMLQRSF
jgi:hypothetical protein